MERRPRLDDLVFYGAFVVLVVLVVVFARMNMEAVFG
jgi:hypothetical protein